MRAGVLGRPRPVPSRAVPLAAGAGLLLLALPVFLVTGWTVKGWILGATLWAASQALGLLLARLRLGASNLAASGMVAFGMMFRAVAVMVVLIAVAVTDAKLALAGALLYALAYSLELGVSIALYFASPAR